MSSSNIHSAKPSYFGDLLNYEFPSSSSSFSSSSTSDQLVASIHTNKNNVSAVIIERAGSIFIKSGIPRVTPFPTLANERETASNVYDKHSKADFGLAHLSNLDEQQSIISESEHNVSKNETVKYFENETEDLKNHVEEPKENKDTEDVEVEIKNEQSQKNSPNSRGRSGTDESHYDEELAPLHKTADLLKKRPSLKPVNSMNTNDLLVNPYFRRSLIRKYKLEVENDEILGDRVKSLGFVEKNTEIKNNEQEQTEGDVTEQVDLAQDDETAPLLIEEETVTESSTLPPLVKIENNDKNELKIPRRSSKRLRNAMNTGTVRLRNISRADSINKTTRLNRSSIRSIQTLASEIRTSLHNQGTKSVDFSNLDKLLAELLELKRSSDEEEGFDESRKNSVSIKEMEINDNGSDLSFAVVKPFNMNHRSISRRTTLRKSLSTVSFKVNNQIKNSPNDTILEDVKPLPKFVNIENNDVEVCELKRSNAIKRKSGIMAGLIILYQILKEFGRRCKRVFKISKKKVVSFGNKQHRNKKEESVKNKVISEPVLIDIHEVPQFKSHNLYKSTSKDTIRTSNSSKNKESGNTSLKTLVPLSKTLSAIESGDEIASELNNSGDVEKDQLIVLWRYYLSKSITNRIDMKTDLSKINQLGRMQSVQSNSSKITKFKKEKDIAIERIMDKYITSRTSSISLTTADSGEGPLNVDAISINLFDENVNASQFTLGLNKLSGTVKTNATTSTGWSTIETGDEELHSDSISGGNDVSSISTIEEESSNFNSISSSVSSLDHHYDEYSFMAEDDDEARNLGGKDRRMPSTTSSELVFMGERNTIHGSFRSSNMKPSFRIMDLQSILKKNRKKGEMPSGQMAEDAKRNASEESYSSMGSSMFSYQASVIV